MPAVLPHVPRAGTTRRWFVDGDVGLAIDVPERQAPVFDALQDAVLLGDLDPLLQHVAQLFDRDFDWVPTTDERPLHVSVIGGSDSRIALALPETLRDRLPVPGERARGSAADRRRPERAAGPENDTDRPPRLVAHRQLARVVLDSMPLDAGDLERLGPGALLLLPASFESQWRALLVLDACDSFRLPVLVDRTSEAVRAHPGPPRHPDGASHECWLTVALVSPVEIALDRWSSDSQAGCDLADGAAMVIETAGDAPDQAVRRCSGLAGRLITLGRGHAVVLDNRH